MKIIVLILFCSTAVGQTQLEAKLSKEICSCLSNEKEVKEYKADIFSKCFFKAATNHYSEMLAECQKVYGDSSYESGKKMGKTLADKLSTLMVESCDIYYSLLKNRRESDLSKIMEANNSASAVIDSLNQIPEAEHGYIFFKTRAFAWFRQRNFEKSIKDFENAVKLDSSDYSTLYMRAWAYELSEQFDIAIKYYEALSKKMKVNLFDIFAAMVRRKLISPLKSVKL
jgi:tetratricopeptide (TPR) repeat protein